MNIIWKQPDNTLALTSCVDGINAEEHAIELQQNGFIPNDWVLVGTEIQWATDERWKHETYRWNGTEIVPDYNAAVDETKQRLREERAPLLQSLDVQFQRNLETGSDNSSIIAEKQRLRDVTKIDLTLDLDQIAELKV